MTTGIALTEEATARILRLVLEHGLQSATRVRQLSTFEPFVCDKHSRDCVSGFVLNPHIVDSACLYNDDHGYEHHLNLHCRVGELTYRRSSYYHAPYVTHVFQSASSSGHQMGDPYDDPLGYANVLRSDTQRALLASRIYSNSILLEWGASLLCAGLEARDPNLAVADALRHTIIFVGRGTATVLRRGSLRSSVHPSHQIDFESGEIALASVPLEMLECILAPRSVARAVANVLGGRITIIEVDDEGWHEGYHIKREYKGVWNTPVTTFDGLSPEKIPYASELEALLRENTDPETFCWAHLMRLPGSQQEAAGVLGKSRLAQSK
jgi:hypothetical protein